MLELVKGRQRAQHELLTTADGALGDRKDGAPDADQIDSEVFTRGVGQARDFLAPLCRLLFERGKEFLSGVLCKHGDRRFEVTPHLIFPPEAFLIVVYCHPH